MIDIPLKLTKTGQLIALDQRDHDLLVQTFRPGQTVRAKLTGARSVPQHRMFFALFQKAFDNMKPVASVPELRDAEHLRAWLLVEAGHCNIYTLDPEDVSKTFVDILKKEKGDVFFYKRRDGKIIVKFANSISFKSLPRSDEATTLFNECLEIICLKIVPGITPEEFVKELENDV